MTQTDRTRPRPATAAGGRARGNARLQLEALEDRSLLAVGALDTTFNGTGLVTTQLLGAADDQFVEGVAVQADGKIVAAGRFDFNDNGTDFDFAVVRYNVNGTLDTTFADGGRALIDLGTAANDEGAEAMALQADGKIVVAGWVTSNTGDQDFAVVRLNSNGSLDTTFDGDGIRIIPSFGGGTLGERAFAVALQTVGGEQRIVLAGASNRVINADFALVRLRSNGALDTSFNAAGTTPGTFTRDLGGSDHAAAVVILNDNSIVAGGFTNDAAGGPNNFALVKVNVDGTGPVDRVFDFAAGADDGILGLAVQQVDGSDRIVAVGWTGHDHSLGGDFDFAIARLRADLSDDTSFDTDGRRTIDFGGSEQAEAVAIQPNSNAIVVVGEAIPADGTLGNFFNVVVARLNTNGSLDTSFDGDGLRTIELGGDDWAGSVAIHPALSDIVVGGSSAQSGATQQFLVARLTGVDQITTVGTYDPATGTWNQNNRNTAGGVPNTFPFGGVGTVGFSGDWDGDGDFTVGIYDQTIGRFFLRNSNTPGAPDIAFDYGGPGVIPVAGDWDGDGRWSIGIYDPTNGNWFLRNSLSSGAPDAGSFQYGGPGGAPVTGDWNGDGITTIGVVTVSTGEWLLNDFNRSGAPTGPPFQYGTPFHKFLAGDWNGDGIWTPGVFTPDGQWALRNSNTSGGVDLLFSFGNGANQPVAGDFDFPAAALRAAGVGPGAPALSSGDLASARDAALARLAAEGVHPDTLALLAAVSIEAQDLPADLLGLALAGENRIVLDFDAAGNGWFVDPTPMQDEEYSFGKPLDPEAARGTDLLTALLHELGHVAGLADDDGSALMSGVLPTGTRRTDGLGGAFGGR